MNKLKIEKTNSSYGNYFVKTSETTFKYFWKKKDAGLWLENYLLNDSVICPICNGTGYIKSNTLEIERECPPTIDKI